MKEESLILEYYDSLASRYDVDRFGNSYGRFVHKQEMLFLERNLLKEKRTLDLGCGSGRFLSFASIGLDFSPKMIQVAKQKFPVKELKVSDAENTGFETGYFDQIFSLHVFMHLSKGKTERVLNETCRILRTGGRFIFDFPSAKRRNLINFSRENWHGANDYSIQELKKSTAENWIIRSYSGILFIPIHRLPRFLRKFLLPLDSWLCKSFLKEYSSYLIVVLEKK